LDGEIACAALPAQAAKGSIDFIRRIWLDLALVVYRCGNLRGPRIDHMSKVLIVDDEPQYGVYLSDWLTREGYEVKTATTAEDAIDFGTHWLPSVLVADWMLTSSLDGLQVSQAVRAANPDLQTILITGYPSQELKARAAEANVFSFIEKPFSLTEVAGAVRRAANISRALFTGHVLLVSPSPTVSQLARDGLRCAGYTAHVAANAPDAVRLLHDSPDVAIAILDCIAPDIDLGILAEELRGLRPNLMVIGSSEADDGQQFLELGIDRFLPRFWDVDDLHAVLVQPIVECTECGLPLPLRRPLPGEEGGSWECRMCGARYQGVMLEDAPSTVQRNVRAAQS
jgi:CheY-like chemotaxis protein